MEQEIKVKVKKLNEHAVIPTKAHEDDACFDLTAIDCRYDAKGDYFEYHTGLAFEIPAGYCMHIYPRSSIRNVDGFFPNSIGVIDAGYRGEVLVTIKNRDRNAVRQPFKVGERIAQCSIDKILPIVFEESDALSDSERGEGGHGSTGKMSNVSFNKK